VQLGADKRELTSWVHAYRLALARVDLRTAWAADWIRPTVPKTLAELRAQYPRLSAGADDDTLIAALRTAERNFTVPAHATAPGLARATRNSARARWSRRTATSSR
jgi:hypothetical protein